MSLQPALDLAKSLLNNACLFKYRRKESTGFNEAKLISKQTHSLHNPNLYTSITSLEHETLLDLGFVYDSALDHYQDKEGNLYCLFRGNLLSLSKETI